MKILLVGNLGSIFLAELASRLSKTDNCEVFVLDYYNCHFTDYKQYDPSKQISRKISRIFRSLDFFRNAFILNRQIKKKQLHFDMG